MRGTPFTLSFALLALCGHGLAGPCKPNTTSTALDGPSSTQGVTSTSAQETTSASTAVSTTTEESSAVESFTSYSSSIISDPVSSIATTTSDALLSSSTELSASSETTDTSDTTTWTTEISTSYTVETTTSDMPVSTTTEQPAPSNLLLNPSFDEPNPDGQFDGSPWAVDYVESGSLNINQDLGRTGSRSAYVLPDQSAGLFTHAIDVDTGLSQQPTNPPLA